MYLLTYLQLESRVLQQHSFAATKFELWQWPPITQSCTKLEYVSRVWHLSFLCLVFPQAVWGSPQVRVRLYMCTPFSCIYTNTSICKAPWHSGSCIPVSWVARCKQIKPSTHQNTQRLNTKKALKKWDKTKQIANFGNKSPQLGNKQTVRYNDTEDMKSFFPNRPPPKKKKKTHTQNGV